MKTRMDIKKALFGLLLLMGVLGMTSCISDMDPDQNYRVSESLLIDEYLRANSELSTIANLVEISTMDGMLHGYGSYTLFAPNDAAMQAFLQSKGKTDVTQLSSAEADELLRYHVIRDSIKTEDMVDGRLPAPTISGKYLTSRVEVDADFSTWYVLNRSGKLTETNVSCKNGVVHVIDQVLEAPTRSVMQTIESFPDSTFSIFKHLMLTYSNFSPDSLVAHPDRSGATLTALVQDNQSYIDMKLGITQEMIEGGHMDSIQSKLLVRLRDNQQDVKSDTTLLNQYVDYHLLPSIRYVSDLLYMSSSESTVKNQVLSFKLKGETLLVNYFELGASIEPGVALNRKSDYSDLSCSDGVVHYIGGQIEIKNRSAFRVYWDLAEQPENLALKDFRKSGANAQYNPGDLSEIKWGGSLTGAVTYYCGSAATSTSFDTKNQYVYGDYMRFRFSPNLNSWFEFTLPMLVEGKYKVWLCWRREQTTTFRSIFRQEGKDDQVLPYVFDLGAYVFKPYSNTSTTSLTGMTEEEALLDGQKQYVAKFQESVKCSRLLGTIVVESTGRHTLRFECLTGRSGETSWDMIQFIPVDDDQIWPKVDIRGKWIYPDTPDCEIWPYNVRVASNYMAETCERP